jgi:WD40 repeat protein
MKAALIILSAIVMLPLCGCDIFIDSFGKEHMPCREPNDCQGDLKCVQQTCVKSDSQSGVTHNVDNGDITSLAMSHDGDSGIWLATSTSATNAGTFVTQVWEIDSPNNVPLVKSLDIDTGHKTEVGSMVFLEAKYTLLAADGAGVRKWLDIMNDPGMMDVSTEFGQVFGNKMGSWTLAVHGGTGNFGLIDSVGVMASATGTHTGGSVNVAAFNPVTYEPTFVTAGKNISEWYCVNTDCSSISSAQQPVVFEGGQITSIDYHSGGNFLAAVLDGPDLNELKVLDQEFGVNDWWNGGESGYTVLAFSPMDYHWLAVGRYDGAVEIWDCHNESNIYVFRVFDNLGNAVEHIAFSKDGRYLVASSGGNFVIIDVDQALPQQD